MNPDSRRLSSLLVCILLVFSGVGGGVAPAVGQQVPSLPAAYYGELVVSDGELNGDVVIEAVADGEVQDSIVVGEDGEMGGPTTSDEQLVVQEPESGSVEFYVNFASDDSEPLTVQTLEGDSVGATSIDFAGGGQELTVEADAEDIEPVAGVESIETNSPIVAGETLSVDASLINIGGAAGSTDVELVVGNETVDTGTVSLSLDTDADNPESVSLSWPSKEADAGTDTVDIVTTDETTSVDVVVETPSVADPDPGNSFGGGGGGGGDSTGDSGSDGSVDLPDSIDLSQPGLSNAEIQSIVSSDQFGISQVRFTTTSAVAEITWQTPELDPQSVVVQTYNQTPPEQPTIPGTVLSAATVSFTGNGTTEPGTYQFRADREALSTANASPSDIQIVQLTNGTWQPLSTAVATTTADTAVVETTVSGAGRFALIVGQPTAALDVPETVTAGSEVTLSAEGSTASYGTIASYTWSIGGATQTGETVTTTFADAGEVTVEATVTNAAGSSDTITTTVSVTEPTPTPTPTATNTADGSETATPTESATDSPTTPAPGEGDSIPGFGVFAALVALLVSTLLYRVRD